MAGWQSKTSSSSIAASSSSEDEQGRIAALMLTLGGVVPAAITALLKLDVFEAFGRAAGNDPNNNGAQGASLTAQEIADVAMPGKSINMGYLERLLRMLASHNVFRETVAPCSSDAAANELVNPIRRFALTPISKCMVKNDTVGSLVDVMLFREQSYPRTTYARIHEAVLENKPDHEPFKIVHGMHLWEYEAQRKNAQEAELFNQMMLSQTKWDMHAILERYEGFKDVRVLVDVGGGMGTALAAITERYPHIHGINFDLPHVIASCLPLQGGGVPYLSMSSF
jgi:caffeic acid 3-O-methyltransferase